MLAGFDEGPSARPSLLCGGDVLILVLCVPGEAISRAHVGDAGKGLQQISFARLPGAFDELHDGNLLAVPCGSEHNAEACGGLALPVAGVHHDDPASDFLARDFGILGCLGLDHACTVLFRGVFGVGGVADGGLPG